MPELNLVTKNTFLHLVDPEEPSSRSKSAPPKMIVASIAEEEWKMQQQRMVLARQDSAGQNSEQLVSQRGRGHHKNKQGHSLDRSWQDGSGEPGVPQNFGGQIADVGRQVAENTTPATKYKRTDLLKKYGGDSVDKEEVTSLMIRHIPCRCSTEDIISEIEAAGFTGLYDFFYMPCDRRQPSTHNLGYAFVNFVSPEAATSFQKAFAGYRFGGESSRSSKQCAISAAAVQGLQNNWSHFRRTAVFRTDRRPAFIRQAARDGFVANTPANPSR